MIENIVVAVCGALAIGYSLPIISACSSYRSYLPFPPLLSLRENRLGITAGNSLKKKEKDLIVSLHEIFS